MNEKQMAPEVLPQCPVCCKRVFCINNIELEKHVSACFEKHAKKKRGVFRNIFRK